MTQLVINIEDSSLVPVLKKMLASMNGVSIATTKTSKGIDVALTELRKGKTTLYANFSEFKKHFDV